MLARHLVCPPGPSLVPLFCTCFGVEAGEAEDILSRLAADATALMAEEDGVPVSQGLMIPMMLGEHFGYYLYALATAPAARGRGYLRALVRAAEDYARDTEGRFLLLIPADGRLSDTYARMGFSEKIGLHASADGARFTLRLPPAATRPFTGDFGELYPLSSRRLPFSAFCVALDSVSDAGRILLTDSGYRVVSRNDEALCFDCDAASLPLADRLPGEGGLIMPLAPLDGLPDTADPLPR